MPYFRYDDWSNLVTELKSKKRLITKKNKILRYCKTLLEKLSQIDTSVEAEAVVILTKIKRSLGEIK
jgi:hypothetical protein